MIVKVALSIPFSRPFDYLVPKALEKRNLSGCRALVSVGARMMIGTVVGISQQSEIENIKELTEVIDESPILSGRMLQLTYWISEYYLCSWGEVIEAAIPGGLKPRLMKCLRLNVQHGSFNSLTSNCKSWFQSIQGKSEADIKRLNDFKLFRKEFDSARKSGVIMFDYSVSSNARSWFIEDSYTLNPPKLDSFHPRKGSKTDRLIDYLRQNRSISQSELRLRFPDSRSSVNLLLSRGIVLKASVELKEPAVSNEIYHDRFLQLNLEQDVAFDQINQSIQAGGYKTLLLFGVTGSGKTEVYLHAVRKTLEKKKTILILIPEISLTPQAVSRFSDRFGKRIAVLHSGLAEGERKREWWRIKRGLCDIVIGARSAIFSPLENIGLIIVDEEHDTSYKQQETPFYNARDIAVKIGADEKATVILGSATPSSESYQNVLSGKYTLLKLLYRANKQPMPEIELINLKEEKRQKGVFYLSRHLVAKLKDNFEIGKQALIFLNRRGYASVLSCQECEMPILCQNCSIALTWHKTEQKLICHHCGYRQPYPKTCPTCKGTSLKLDGIGTQRIERDLRLLFPQACFLRMDRDTIRRKGALEANINAINNKKVDFIIGTQLISKGHDFKHVGLVCLVLADMSLNIPDFRSSERTFQLISQVSGRAGRDESGIGFVSVQTYNPQHYAIEMAVQNNVTGFLESELANRKLLDNPPHCKMILVRVSGANPLNVEKSAVQMAKRLQKNVEKMDCQMMGPISAPIAKINNRFYWQIIFKGNDAAAMKRLLRYLFWDEKKWRPVGSTRITFDVDPHYLL